jgi:hypothetical protein
MVKGKQDNIMGINESLKTLIEIMESATCSDEDVELVTKARFELSQLVPIEALKKLEKLGYSCPDEYENNVTEQCTKFKSCEDCRIAYAITNPIE